MKRAIVQNTHPGEILYELIIRENNLSVEQASKLLGVTRPNLSNILNCKSAISPTMAIRLSKVFGGNAGLWLRMQYAYDLRRAERDFEEKNIQLEKFQPV